jgi:hypothetical protein
MHVSYYETDLPQAGLLLLAFCIELSYKISFKDGLVEWLKEDSMMGEGLGYGDSVNYGQGLGQDPRLPGPLASTI